jgi:hypothetical protein
MMLTNVFCFCFDRRIFHPNVVLFLGACTADNNLMIVTELMETDLERLLRSHKNLTLLEKLRLAKDAVCSRSKMSLYMFVSAFVLTNKQFSYCDTTGTRDELAARNQQYHASRSQASQSTCR